MNRNDDIIADYLDGKLSDEAREEFENLLQTDRGLEHELQAEQAIRRSIESDLSSIPIASAVPSTAITMKLVASQTEGITATSGGILGTIFGTTLGLTIVSAVGLAGLILGIVFSSARTESDDQSVEGQEQFIAPNPGQNVEDIQPSIQSQEKEAGRENVTNQVIPPSTIKEGQPKEQESGATSVEEAERSPLNAEAANDQEDLVIPTTEKESESDEILKYLQEKEVEDDIPVIKSDSLRLKLKIDD